MRSPRTAAKNNLEKKELAKGRKEEGSSGRGSNIQGCRPLQNGRFLACAEGKIAGSSSREGHRGIANWGERNGRGQSGNEGSGGP